MQSLSILSGPQTSEEQSAEAAQERIRRSFLPDWLGVVASIGCAIHCAAMPFVITFLPMLGLSFLADESFHKVMVGICALLALLAFVPGWRVHRRWLPAGIAMAGLTVIGAAAFALEVNCACCTLPENYESANIDQRSEASLCADEHCEHCSKAKEAEVPTEAYASPALAGFIPWITPLGGFLLISAHLVNRHFSCRCGCCPPKTSGA